MKSRYLIISLIGITLLLVLFSFISILQEAQKEKLEGELKSLIRGKEEIEDYWTNCTACQNIFNNPLRKYIKTYNSGYSSELARATANLSWYQQHYDLGTSSRNASRYSLTYVSWTDRRWEYLVPKGFDFNEVALHYSKDYLINKTHFELNNHSFNEDRFYKIYRYNGTYHDLSSSVYPSIVGEFSISLCNQQEDIVYMGMPWKFREINFNVLSGSDSFINNFKYTVGIGWENLELSEDSTRNLSQSGSVRFFPPENWNNFW